MSDTKRIHSVPVDLDYFRYLPRALTPARFFFLSKPFAKFSNGGKMKNWVSGATEV